MPTLGIDLGGTKLLACGLDDRGEVRFRKECATGRAFGPEQALAALERIVREARVKLGAPTAIGIGFPGLVDHSQGVARSSVILDGWEDEPLAARVEASLGLPCAIDNDVNAAALCEQQSRGALDMLFVAVGTGIGGALVLDGRLRRGAGGFAGEIGHLSIDRDGLPCACGRRGCVNRYASGTAIEAALGISAGDLRIARAQAGDALEPVLMAAADALGAAIGSALNLLDLSLVVLGGGVAEFGTRYISAVAARARRECFGEIGRACRFEAAHSGYDTAAIGAALLARQRLGSMGQPHSIASWRN